MIASTWSIAMRPPRGQVELQQVAQIHRRQVGHAAAELQILRVAVGADRALQQVHQLRRIGVLLAARALAIEAADRQRRDAGVERGVVADRRVEVERVIPLATDLGGHAGEQVVHQRAAEAHRLEIIAAAVGGDHRDPHLAHDLEQSLLHRGAMAREALVEGQIAEQAACMAIRDRGLGQIGVHRRRADADQHRVIMRVEALGGAHVDGRVGAQSLADEVRVDRRRRQHAGDADARLVGRLVGQEQLAVATAHRLLGLVADALDRGAQAIRAAARLERAVDLRHAGAEMRLQPRPALARQHG